MPRPGPRPYECVRRAWHSERHQPMRGSIIQKIFRAVHERHSTVTKKNTEWQIKLPIVVFKAEEIMYSKANSEAEYMDPETLWDRANDAIDLIIRRDESTETGQLLPPCVEAALVLGCVAERTSRSQRNSKPRNYLSPRTEEPCPMPPKVMNQTSHDHNSNSQSPHSGNQPTFARPPPHTKLVTLASEGNTNNMGAVYPLYEGTKSGFHRPQTQSNMVTGRPIYPSITQPPAEANCLHSFFSKPIDNERPREECDLSLRLGQSLDCDLHLGNASASGGFNPRPSDDSNERGKSKANQREFCFFRPESEGRKRKLPFHDSIDNARFFSHDGPAFNQLKRPGL